MGSVKVRVNGSLREEFGETFAGVPITAQDKGEAIIRTYSSIYSAEATSKWLEEYCE